MKQSMQILTSSKTNEWYTPPYHIAIVRRVLGSIDLDPASHWVPQQWIKAKEFYIREEDGLLQTWRGTVYLNCPYGKTGNRSNQEIWAAKLINSFLHGEVTAAILLTKTVPGYVWWDALFDREWPGPCCITRGRIAFIKAGDPQDPHGTTGRSKAASTFWYCGPRPELFAAVFSQIGRVIPRQAK